MLELLAHGIVRLAGEDPVHDAGEAGRALERVGLRASTISFPRSQRTNRNGPVPTGAAPKASPFCSATSRGDDLGWPSARTETNGADASVSATCTVCGSSAVSPLTARARPRGTPARLMWTNRSAASD